MKRVSFLKNQQYCIVLILLPGTRPRIEHVSDFVLTKSRIRARNFTKLHNVR